MGQYYKVVNLDKKEWLNPHQLGDGLKLMEFGQSTNGTMTALAILLANSNGRGGGDFKQESPLIGSWAGNRIVIAGDYAYKPDPGEDARKNEALYYRCEKFKNISLEMRELMERDCIKMNERWDKSNGRSY